MMIGAFGAPRWASYRSPDYNYQYGLYLCTDGDGDDAREGQSWYCAKKDACESTGRSGMCILTQDMMNAFKSYWVLEYFALLWVLLTMVRLLGLFFKRDHGPNWLLYLFLAGGILTHCAAIMTWFAITNASFMDDCTVDSTKLYNRPNVCAEEGAKLSIAVIFALFIATLLTILILHKDKRTSTTVRMEFGKLKCMPYRVWLILSSILMFSGLFLVIASAAVQDWLQVNSETGTLFNLNNWHGVDDVGYECISEPLCTADQEPGACDTFRSIKRAGRAYLMFIVAVFFAWALWKDGWLMLMLRRDYCLPAFYHVLPHLTWFLQLTGMVVWFGVSQANFYTNCDAANVIDKWSICSDDGPILAIVGTLVLFLAAVLFHVAFLLRHKQYVAEKEDGAEMVPQSDRQLSEEAPPQSSE